ncbi:hypothetical protein FTV88_0434 [Heliorestis convoluta]|uniref:Uncharacterized protein n=1 Tax=Heliorestis convoluta TaxID=356322 RepID=A0A5Q2MYV4_9FIRM|nr:hypothetical protein FTV88_0434 [Heliorestis convoluta]
MDKIHRKKEKRPGTSEEQLQELHRLPTSSMSQKTFLATSC